MGEWGEMGLRGWVRRGGGDGRERRWALGEAGVGWREDERGVWLLPLDLPPLLQETHE